MLISQRPTLHEEFVTESRSRFTIEPLEPGFGYTIGNSLRRALLSSIPGAAVTSVRIDGVLHEFSTITGVTEDVTEIVLNLKHLVVSSEDDEPVTMYLRKQGPGEVTGADIVPPAGVTIHNPDLHIATLSEKGKLDMELVVERGRGYVPAPDTKVQGVEIGRIPMDAIYSPVLKVSYKVEAPALGSGPTSTSWLSTWKPRTPSPPAMHLLPPEPLWLNSSACAVSSTPKPKVSSLGLPPSSTITLRHTPCRSTTSISLSALTTA